MEEQENNNHLSDFLEVLQDQHREIKKMSSALERLSATENPFSGKIDKLAKEIEGIKSGLHQLKKDEGAAYNFAPVQQKVDLILEITRAEMRQYAEERRADILVKVKSRKLLIWSIVCLFIGILGIIMSACYWRKNRGLLHNDLKYRYYKMSGSSPQLIDSLYQISPGKFRDKVLKLEQQGIAENKPGTDPMKSDAGLPAKEKKKKANRRMNQ